MAFDIDGRMEAFQRTGDGQDLSTFYDMTREKPTKKRTQYGPVAHTSDYENHERIKRKDTKKARNALGKEFYDTSLLDEDEISDIVKRGGFMGLDWEDVQDAAGAYANAIGDTQTADYFGDDDVLSDEQKASAEKGQDLRNSVEWDSEDYVDPPKLQDDRFLAVFDRWLNGEHPTTSISGDRLHDQDIQSLSLASEGKMDTAYKLFRRRYPGADEGLFVSFLYAANLPQRS